MLIAALGGEGGGVLTNWLIDAADRSGWHCQSTSLAGLAQRTGATIYYLEFIHRESDVPYPVMSLLPCIRCFWPKEFGLLIIFAIF